MVPNNEPGVEPEVVDTAVMEIVADNMKFRRKQLGVSRQVIADRMGLNQSTIYLYEKAEREIPLSRIRVLAHALQEPNWIRLLQVDYGRDPQVPAWPVAEREHVAIAEQDLSVAQLTPEQREQWALFNRFLEFERRTASGDDCLRL